MTTRTWPIGHILSRGSLQAMSPTVVGADDSADFPGGASGTTRSSVLKLLATLAVVLLGACGGDSGTGPEDRGGDNMTAQELGALMSTFTSSTFEVTPEVIAGEDSFSVTIPCSQGGDIQIAGTITGDLQRNDMTFDVTLNYRQCQDQSAAGAFLIDGSLRETGAVIFDQAVQNLSYTFNLTGGFNWELEGRSGDCQIDVTLQFTQAQQVPNTTGSICGESAAALLT